MICFIYHATGRVIVGAVLDAEVWGKLGNLILFLLVLQATGLAIIEQRLKQTRQDKASKHTIKTNYLDNELDDPGSSTGMSAPGQ
jgi:hypothetical protein